MIANFEEADRLYWKACSVHREAEQNQKECNYDLCVRRCQEAVELYLKSLFLFLGKTYPKSHDVRDQVYEIFDLLKKYDVKRETVAKMVLANQVLNLWRNPSFYGDEKLGISGIFSEKEATLALYYTTETFLECSQIKYLIKSGQVKFI